MIIVRFILILMIVYLLVKGFIQSLYLEDNHNQGSDRQTRRKQKPPEKKVSKEIGEYIDYEEVKK